MASKEYKQMIQRGKWLEKFLNPKLKSWGYKELALEFIDIYQVYFEFSKNDKSIEFLVEIEKKSEYYKCDGIISYNFDVRIQKALSIKQQINHVFQAIISTSKPWGYQFSEEKEMSSQEECNNKYELPELYNRLVKLMSVGEDGLEFKRAFSFGTTLSLVAVTGKSLYDFFPWDVAAARMFFDFLLLGGQEYFLFCKYCGNFSVIERKGRKKFCSDICKTRYRTSNLT